MGVLPIPLIPPFRRCWRAEHCAAKLLDLFKSCETLFSCGFFYVGEDFVGVGIVGFSFPVLQERTAGESCVDDVLLLKFLLSLRRNRAQKNHIRTHQLVLAHVFSPVGVDVFIVDIVKHSSPILRVFGNEVDEFVGDDNDVMGVAELPVGPDKGLTAGGNNRWIFSRVTAHVTAEALRRFYRKGNFYVV